ncbi:hypothetical protein BH10PSE2_BH10PSE2_09840 [soil metagenome]
MTATSYRRSIDRSPSAIYRLQKSIASREVFIRVLLTILLGLCLWRATGMAYGLPARFADTGDNGRDSTTFMKFLLYSLIPLLLTYCALEPSRILGYFQKVNPAVAILSAICVASIFVSPNPAASIRGLTATGLITVAVLAYRLRYGAAETWRTIGLMVSWAVIANVVYTLAFPQFAIMAGSYQGMVKGLFFHKNLMGHFVTISFFLILLNEKTRIGLSRDGILKTVALACSLILIVASRSSTAVVMLFAGLGLLAWLTFLKPVRGTWLRTSITFFVGVGGGILVAVVYSVVLQMIATSFGKDTTLSGRSEIWTQLVPLILDRPFLGYGFAMFRQPEVISMYVHDTFNVGSTHSTYLELCLNIGVPGAVLMVALAAKRLIEKAGSQENAAEGRNVQAKETVVIVLVLLASGLDAGMMLAPIILWPLLVISLVKKVAGTRRLPPLNLFGRRTPGRSVVRMPPRRRGSAW